MRAQTVTDQLVNNSFPSLGIRLQEDSYRCQGRPTMASKQCIQSRIHAKTILKGDTRFAFTPCIRYQKAFVHKDVALTAPRVLIRRHSNMYTVRLWISTLDPLMERLTQSRRPLLRGVYQREMCFCGFYTCV